MPERGLRHSTFEALLYSRCELIGASGKLDSGLTIGARSGRHAVVVFARQMRRGFLRVAEPTGRVRRNGDMPVRRAARYLPIRMNHAVRRRIGEINGT